MTVCSAVNGAMVGCQLAVAPMHPPSTRGLSRTSLRSMRLGIFSGYSEFESRLNPPNAFRLAP